MADDQGKGKIVPRKGLFVQEHDFLSSIPSWDTFFHSAGRCTPPVQKLVNTLGPKKIRTLGFSDFGLPT